MAHEELELLTDIRDFTTLCSVILRHKSFEWLEPSLRYGSCHLVPLLVAVMILLSSNTLSSVI